MTFTDNDWLRSRKLDLLPPVARNYADWELAEDRYAQHVESRLADGVSNVDVWNFDEYISVVAANGILRLGARASGLRDFQKQGGTENPVFADKSLDDVLSETVTILNAHACDSDSFYDLMGKECLNESLRVLLLVLPYLYDDWMADPGYVGKPPVNDLDTLSEDQKRTHRLQRETFGVSKYDALRFDLYFTGAISRGLAILSGISHGHPGNLSFEEWQGILLSLSKAFGSYSRGETDSIDPDTTALFIKWFPHLWD